MVSQTQFQAGLLDADVPAPDGVINPDGSQATKRYDVYRNNVAVSLTDALGAAFPVIKKLVGDRFFRAMAGVYVRKHPPNSPLMMFYGTAFPQFLRRFPPTKSLAYLPDVALVEIAMRNAYHAADAAPIDANILATLAPDQLMSARFSFAPATTLLRADYPIHSIYRANTVSGAPAPKMRPEAMLITRPQFDPVQTMISPAAFDCITSLKNRNPLGVAMASAGPDLNLGTTLGLLLGQGAVSAIS